MHRPLEDGQGASCRSSVGWGVMTIIFCGIVILLGAVGAEGHWTYPLDDAYIHLSLARNLAETGVWGIQPGEYAFCSSSPLWTLLLAFFFKLFFYSEWLPGILSVCFAAAAVFSLADLLQPLGRWKRLICLGAILLSLPVAVIGTLGMEHALHVWLTILLLKVFMRYRKNGGPAYKIGIGLAVVGMLATAVRMESLFLILPMAALLVGEKRWRMAVGLVAASCLPIVLYGLYAQANGGHWLPNSLLLKGHFHTVQSLLLTLVRLPFAVHFSNLHLYLLVVLMGYLTFASSPCEGRTAGCVFVAIGGQLVFAQCPNFYRYDAFLIAAAACCVFAGMGTGSIWRGGRRFRFLGALILLLSVAWLGLRGMWATMRAVQAPANIYGQQIQLARIFSGLPADQRGVIALNDLGCLSLYANAPVVDLWGLGSQPVAELKTKGTFDAAAIEQIFAKYQVKYVVVFDEWIPRRLLPANVIRVGQLSISGNHVCLSPDVMLYATSPEAANALRARLAEIQKTLPRQTSVTVIKLEGELS